MSRQSDLARTFASGRFLLLVFLSLSLGSLVGCRIAGAPGAGGTRPATFPDPVLEPGGTSPAREARAAELFAMAEEALAAGRAGEAEELATQVVEEFANAPVSGRALWLLARAALEAGDYLQADVAAERFAGLLMAGDPRAFEARLLQARAEARSGNHAGSLARLLRLGPDMPRELASVGAEDARRSASQLEREDLETLLAESAPGQPFRFAVLTAYAALLQALGEDGEARRQAQLALDQGAIDADSADAVAIRSGLPPAPIEDLTRAWELQSLSIATVLPIGGSPNFQEFALLIAEGVEVAAAAYPSDRLPIVVEGRDDRGDPTVAASIVEELEDQNVLGAVGFLTEGALEAAAGSRRDGMALVSPTARTVSGPGVYALSGVDPEPAAVMARHAASAGYRRVAMIHSRAPAYQVQADAFEATLRELGVPLVGKFVYDAGATYFAPQVQGVQEALRGAEIRALGLGPEDTLHVEMLEPVALFLPVPPEDVELLAPQITFFGLDTLAVQILGTAGWTDGQVLETVDPRHTTGVIATAPLSSGPGSTGYVRFREAYERHFQRTLVSPVPALGYDAALLLLEGIRTGARTPTELRGALERVRDLEGATGVFSIVEGRVLRAMQVVRIDAGDLVPLGP